MLIPNKHLRGIHIPSTFYNIVIYHPNNVYLYSCIIVSQVVLYSYAIHICLFISPESMLYLFFLTNRQIPRYYHYQTTETTNKE